MCTWLLAMTVHSQYNERDRLVSTNPLRNGDGSFVKANNPLFYNNTPADTLWTKKRINNPTNNSDPFAFWVNSIQALCDVNSLELKWTSVQRQSDADYFDIEQSDDAGITWTKISSTPANRYQMGNVPYNFIFNKSLGNVDLRVAAVNTSGEKRYSSIVRSACSNTNLLSVDNLVYSTANIRIGSAVTQNIKMILVNSSGIVVRAREAGLTQGVNSISLDMSGLHTDIYTLTIIWTGGGQRSVQIVKK
jgi:hypothetical protein